MGPGLQQDRPPPEGRTLLRGSPWPVAGLGEGAWTSEAPPSSLPWGLTGGSRPQRGQEPGHSHWSPRSVGWAGPGAAALNTGPVRGGAA